MSPWDTRRADRLLLRFSVPYVHINNRQDSGYALWRPRRARWKEMRWQWRTRALVVLLIVGWMYLIAHLHFFLADQSDVENYLRWHAERPVSRSSWVEQGQYLPLNVSYELLAGSPSPQQRFLTVGISSVQRSKGIYLIETLQSIFSQSSPEECSSMVVVVLLADFDHRWRASVTQEIQTAFQKHLEHGQLVVIHVPRPYYPPLTGLKRNYNDASDRVSFRSKQNVDYSYLVHYSVGLGQFYLQLEDDVFSSKNFLSSIRRHIKNQDEKKATWATLEFSTLGYIGKLYKSTDLPLLARFFFLFYQEMPCDWLLVRFRDLLTQKEPIIFKPSLFQHMGTFSSFRGTFNKLKDVQFEDGGYSNPKAEVYTNMSAYKEHLPRQAWEPGQGFFWGRSPDKGDHFTIVLEKPAVVTEMVIETGNAGKDLLHSAQVELGQDVVDAGQSCRVFLPVGKLVKGVFEIQNVNRTLDQASSCLRIQVTAAQQDWVIIRKIRIVTKP